MRYIVLIGIFFFFLITSLYGVLFTESGNEFLTPYVQKQLEKMSNRDIKMKNFHLTSTQLHCSFVIDKNSSIELYGPLSLLDMKVKLYYNALLKDIKLLNFNIKDDINISGRIIGDDDSITIKGDSPFIGGETDYTIKLQRRDTISFDARDVKVTLHKVSSLEILHLLSYPALFDAKVNGDFTYNLQTQKGDSVLYFLDGKFIENSLFDTLKTYTRANLYDEVFQGYMKAHLNKELLSGTFHVKSEKSVVDSESFSLEMAQREIDSNISVSVYNYPVYARIQGNINRPEITFDLNRVMNSQTGDMIKKEIQGFLKRFF